MVSLAKENKTARSLKGSSVLYVGLEKAKDVVPGRRKKESELTRGESSPRTALFFSLCFQESHNTCKRRQDWTENGQETFRTSKGTCRVESVRAALPRPDSCFLPLALLVWDRALRSGHAAWIQCLKSAGGGGGRELQLTCLVWKQDSKGLALKRFP